MHCLVFVLMPQAIQVFTERLADLDDLLLFVHEAGAHP
jgi:hypothetical protein